MKEKDFINIIKNTLDTDYIGDDCAFLKDLGIVVSQDSLVENVHFSLDYISAYELGYKSAMVNISDIAASGAEPVYMTVALSLPKNIDEIFVKNFYEGMKKACGSVKIVGGDITGSEKIFISVSVIGKVVGRKISSRKYAKVGQKIVVSGNHGTSAAGLQKLQSSNNIVRDKFVNAHLMPEAQVIFSQNIATKIDYDYAMMDTSDGLAEALSTIAVESGVLMAVDFEKIPRDKDIESFENWEDLVLYGGEDYQLVATLDEKDCSDKIVIGEVKKGLGVEIKYEDEIQVLQRQDIEKKLYNHFKN